MSSAVGMWSDEAAEKRGTVFWATPSGEEVEITAYCKPEDYKWKDARVIGQVTHYVRQGRQGKDRPLEICYAK